MKHIVHYVKGNPESEKQADVAFNSFKKFGYQVEKKFGITPATVSQYDNYNILPGSRLESFSVNDNNERKFQVKKSCVLNNIEFAQAVVAADQPMVFLEHDAECVLFQKDLDFDEYCYLAIETWNKPPSGLALNQFREYNPLYGFGVNDFPSDWPLTYHKETEYKGANLTPGTMAYALSPKGAKKILHAAETTGLEQSDFLINSKVVRLQYVFPAIVRHQSKNLNLSHRL